MLALVEEPLDQFSRLVKIRPEAEHLFTDRGARQLEVSRESNS